jgi:hypothetical protein
MIDRDGVDSCLWIGITFSGCLLFIDSAMTVIFFGQLSIATKTARKKLRHLSGSDPAFKRKLSVIEHFEGPFLVRIANMCRSTWRR